MSKAAVVAQVEPRLLERLKVDGALVEDVACDCLQLALDSSAAAAPTPQAVHLGTDWHALHFLISGRAGVAEDEPLTWAVLGGDAVAGALGGSPVRLLAPERVGLVARALAALRPEELAKGFNLDALVDADLYRVCASPERLASHLRRLTRCYLAAAAQGRAMLLFHAVSVPAPLA